MRSPEHTAALSTLRPPGPAPSAGPSWLSGPPLVLGPLSGNQRLCPEPSRPPRCYHFPLIFKSCSFSNPPPARPSELCPVPVISPRGTDHGLLEGSQPRPHPHPYICLFPRGPTRAVLEHGTLMRGGPRTQTTLGTATSLFPSGNLMPASLTAAWAPCTQAVPKTALPTWHGAQPTQDRRRAHAFLGL